MKKTVLYSGVVMMLFVAMTVVSCTKETNTASMSVGKWTCTASKAINPHSSWGTEADNALKGNSVTFRNDGTYKTKAPRLVDNSASTGYWSISEKHLYINGTQSWWVKGHTETSLKIETYFVEGVGLTIDTAGVPIVYGPISREFKKE